jgi:thiol-disulfide isomerase/thioredoxin
MVMHFVLQWTALLFFVLSGASCSKDPPQLTQEPAAAPSPKESPRIEWIKAPVGEDAATIVKRELERAHNDKKRLLVYVGAPWCEPCKRFHDAAENGQLDGVFPNLRLVEFDRWICIENDPTFCYSDGKWNGIRKTNRRFGQR